MFDQSTAHAFDYSEPDTEVVDEPLLPPFPRGRVDTKDLIVHVRDDNDAWHRLHPTKLVTACGLSVTNWKSDSTRRGLHIEHPLADCHCWTPFERDEADAAFRLGHSGKDFEP